MKNFSTRYFFGLSGLSLCLAIVQLATKLSIPTPEVPITNTELIATAAPEACALRVGTLSITSNLCAGDHTYSYDNTGETGIVNGVINGHFVYKNGMTGGAGIRDDENLLGSQQAFNTLNFLTDDPGQYCIVTFAYEGGINDIDLNSSSAAALKSWLTSLNCASFTEYCFTVNPVPAAEQFGTAPAICSGNPFSIDLNARITNGVPSTFTWFASYPAGIPIPPAKGDCLNPNICGSSINETLINTAGEPRQVTYTVTAISASGCESAPFQITIVINPVPVAMAANKSICSGGMTELDVTDPRNITGANFNWTAEYNGVTGGDGSAMGVAFGTNAINETLTNNTNAPIDVVYTITPLTSSCSGPSIEVRVTVNPNPTFVAEDITVCAGTEVNLFDAIVSQSIPGGNTGFGNFYMSEQGAIDEDVNDVVPLNIFTPTQGGVTTYWYRLTDQQTGCYVVKPFTLTVNPNPEITAQPEDVTICLGGSASFTVGATVSGGATLSYQWQLLPNGGINWQNTNSITETLVLAGPLTMGANGNQYRVIVTSNSGTDDTSDDCTVTSEPATLTVLPDPDVTLAVADGASSTICVTKSTELKLTVEPIPLDDFALAINCTVFVQEEIAPDQWETVAGGEFSQDDLVDNMATLTLEGLSPGVHKYRALVQCTIDDKSAGCEGISETVEITVLNVGCGEFPWRGNE